MNIPVKAKSELISPDKNHKMYANASEVNQGENYIDLSIESFQNICRLCLISPSEMDVKFCTNDENIFLYKLCSSVLSIMVDVDDRLPLNICKACQLKILEFHGFKKSVLNVQYILTNILETHTQEDHFMQPLEKSDIAAKENPIVNKDDSKGKYRCRFCKETFNDVPEYRKHLKTEQEKRKEQFSPCTICKKLFTKGKLIAHVKIHSKIQDQTFHCDRCGKTYKTNRNLIRHSLTHTGMPYVCDICGKGFREANLLRDHLNVHSGLSPYICKTCGSSYPTSSALRLHKAYKHSGKVRNYPKTADKNAIRTPKKKRCSFPCEICGKVYASKAIVNYHILTHSGERNFQCNDCGKMFANKIILGDHRRIHRLSYKCRLCERSFAYAASLETHINSHTGQKPHECNTCKKRYSNKSHLKEHIRSHTGERPYSCRICWKRFAAKGNLNGHMKTHKKQSDR